MKDATLLHCLNNIYIYNIDDTPEILGTDLSVVFSKVMNLQTLIFNWFVMQQEMKQW